MRGRDSISGRFAPVRRRGTRSTTGTAVRDDATPVSHPPAASERAAGQSANAGLRYESSAKAERWIKEIEMRVWPTREPAQGFICRKACGRRGANFDSAQAPRPERISGSRGSADKTRAENPSP